MNTGKISEETLALVHAFTGHSKPPRLQEDTITQAEFREKTVSELQYLSRKHGRSWGSFKDIPLGVNKRAFFICTHRNEVMTPDRQAEELEKTGRILCIGCPLAARNGKQLLCVGHVLRLAWHRKHPDKPRYYGDPRWEENQSQR